MVLLIAEDCATCQVDEGLRESNDDWNSALQLLLVRFQRQSAVTEHDATFPDVANGVHFVFNLELSDALVGRLHRIARFIGSVLLELGR